MELRDLRIAEQTRKLIDYERALCVTDFDIEKLYRDAKDFVFTYNSRHKNDPPETLLSAAKVHAFGVLHLLYQVVATTYDEAQGGTFFRSLKQEASASESTMETLRFYDRQFPSVLPDDQKNIRDLSSEDVRGLFLHRVFLENPALSTSASPSSPRRVLPSHQVLEVSHFWRGAIPPAAASLKGRRRTCSPSSPHRRRPIPNLSPNRSPLSWCTGAR